MEEQKKSNAELFAEWMKGGAAEKPDPEKEAAEDLTEEAKEKASGAVPGYPALKDQGEAAASPSDGRSAGEQFASYMQGRFGIKN